MMVYLENWTLWFCVSGSFSKRREAQMKRWKLDEQVNVCAVDGQ